MKNNILLFCFILIAGINCGQEIPYDSIMQELFKIDYDDQKYRTQLDYYEQKYGWDSKEYQDLLINMSKTDSITTIKVTAIIDKYGWIGTDKIGSQCNSTLFMVIQHSNLETQEKYLPIMNEAVKNGKAKPSNLAMLEDRIAMRKGEKQIYGSQLMPDNQKQILYLAPLLDPDNVDKRRAEVGLPPLAEYLENWKMKWDMEQYKKDLPFIEAKQKEYFSNQKSK